MYCFEQKCKNIEHPSIVNSYEVTFFGKKKFSSKGKTRENEGSLFSVFALSHFFSVCVSLHKQTREYSLHSLGGPARWCCA